MTKPTLAKMVEDEMSDMTTPLVRGAAVARGRALVEANDWHHTDEVAAEMLACMMARRQPV